MRKYIVLLMLVISVTVTVQAYSPISIYINGSTTLKSHTFYERDFGWGDKFSWEIYAESAVKASGYALIRANTKTGTFILTESVYAYESKTIIKKSTLQNSSLYEVRVTICAEKGAKSHAKIAW